MINATNFNLIERWQEVAERYPMRPAIHAEGQYFTYVELRCRASEIAGEIRSRCSENEKTIALYTTDRFDTYAALWAIWACGKTVVPLLPQHPAERLQFILNASEASLLLSTEPLDFPFLPTLFLASFSGTADFSLTPTPSDQPAYLLFTSGSTGQPKGVPVLWRNVNAFTEKMVEDRLYAFASQDRFLQMFDLTFDLAFFGINTAWSVGACLCVVPQQGIKSLNVIQTLEEQQITVALMPPSVLAFLQNYFDEIELPHLRYSLFCGEALIEHLLIGWKRCIPFAQIENVYGPTEATIFCSRYRWQSGISESLNGIVSIGKPMEGMTFTLDNLDEATGVGELILSGDQLTTGYHRNEAKTAEQFFTKDGTLHYRTGDLVSVSETGNYLFHGRKDQQVKIDGYRVELGEIEHHLRTFCQTDQAVVVTQANSAGTVSLHAFLVGYSGDLKTLRRYLTEQLPSYMQPTSITPLDAFPLNDNGKIDRKRLASPAVPV